MTEKDTRLVQAEALLHADRNEQALATAGQVLAEQPDNHAAGALVVRALLDMERFREAQAAAAGLLSFHPNSEQGWRLHALASAQAGDFNAGWQSSRRAVQLDPTEWRTHVVAVKVDIKAGHPSQDSWAHALEAVRLAPDEEETHTELGNLAMRMGHNDTARQAFNEALRLDPDNFVAQHNLGVLALRSGRSAEAASKLASLLSSNPTSGLTLRNLDALLIRVVLWLYVALYVGWFLSVSSLNISPEPPYARPVAGIAALVVIIGGGLYLARIVRQGGVNFARYLRNLPHRSPMLVGTFGCLVLATLGLVWVAVAPVGQDAAALLSIVALLASGLCTRIASYRRRKSR